MDKKRFDVTVVGGIIQDLISFVPRMPKVGETLIGNKFISDFGGKGANQATMAARMGARTAMIAKVGTDVFGSSALQNIAKNHINCEHVTSQSSIMTGTSVITVSNAGENSIVCVLGANLSLAVADIVRAESVISSSAVLLCQLENRIDVISKALELAKKSGTTTIFNPAPASAELPPGLIKHCDIICPNETEAEILTGIPIKSHQSVEEALKRLLQLGAKTAIITLGANGCAYACKGDGTVHTVNAVKVDVVDTTGAGDAFLGALAFYTAKYGHLSLAERLRRCCIIASTSVQHPGTQSSYLNREDLSSDLFA